MTHVLFLDAEQGDLIRIAAEAASAMLDARSRRVDPDYHISESVKMQRLKVQQVLGQLDKNELPLWQDIPKAERATMHKIMAALIEYPEAHNAADLWSALIATAMGLRSDRAVTPRPASAR